MFYNKKSQEIIRRILRLKSENVRVLGRRYWLIEADIGKCLYSEVSACSWSGCNFWNLCPSGTSGNVISAETLANIVLNVHQTSESVCVSTITCS